MAVKYVIAPGSAELTAVFHRRTMTTRRNLWNVFSSPPGHNGPIPNRDEPMGSNNAPSAPSVAAHSEGLR